MKALIVIDMLNDFVEEEGLLYSGEGAQEIIPFIKEKIDEYRKNGDQIIYICDAHEEDDSEFEMFPKHCVNGTRGAEIYSELAPEKGDKIIDKRRYSGFFGTDLDLTLREKGITEIALVGVCTNICVLYTTADARNLGYDVTVYKDGVATFDEESHEFALKEMGTTLGAKVL